MSWELLFILFCAIVAALLIIFRKNPYVKQYWRYALILIPFILLVILIYIQKRGGKVGAPSEPSKSDPLADAIGTMKSKMQETQTVAQIEVVAAKAKDKSTLEQLEKVRQIQDQDEKTRQLTAMAARI
jgi:hypothetical protein